MTPPFRLAAAESDPRGRLGERVRGYFLDTWRGRILLTALAVEALAILLSVFGLRMPALLHVPACVVLWLYGLFYGSRLLRHLLRRLLWRIRTKLILSYVFVAAVPLVLVVAFVALAAFLIGMVLSSHLVSAHVERHSREMQIVARTTLAGLDFSDPRLGTSLAARLAPVRDRFASLRYSLVRGGRTLAGEGSAPRALPEWLTDDDFAGLVKTSEGDVIRAVARQGTAFLVLDRPFDRALLDEIERETDLHIRPEIIEREARPGETGGHVAPPKAFQTSNSLAIVERLDWSSGRKSAWVAPVSLPLMAAGHRLAPALEFAEWFPVVMTAVGVLFLVLYAFALLIGLLLARSVTRNVHALHQGTLKLGEGDFWYRIPVRGRDQLADLAQSFNLMAQGIQELLREQAEKDRLEEELRIARQIQMSLLPASNVTLPGLRVAALCIPAAEVGGDYYDLLPLSESRMAVVVADVSGKGTSAALYMAELKGLVLSLARTYESPARLLSEANRILAANLDSHSFITMTYAVVDTRERRMRFARAGHNPIIHLEAASGRTRVLAPPGLGLALDSGERFDAIIEEAEVALVSGDTFVFFTDGLSEALSPDSELFGEPRLRRVMEESLGLDSEAMRERILDAVKGFAGGVALHDDMTLVVLRIV
jgi:serine phosphatase RsbU (regulator of sigma subunit)